MKIFKMDDYDCWMDIDLESAKKNYWNYLLKIIKPGELDIVEARELSELEMDSFIFYYGCCEDDIKSCTFREHMNELEQVPQFFASTEY